MASPQVPERRAARVLVVDDAGRILLLRGRDPARPGSTPYWFTVGGGLLPGETPVQGAVREMAEETGLRTQPADLVGPVWHEVAEFSLDGADYVQTQEYFAVRVSSGVPVDMSGLDDLEVRSVDAYRWWTAEEIRETTESVYPRCLPELMEAL